MQRVPTEQTFDETDRRNDAKKTNARMIGALTKESTSAKAIQALFGQTSARGRTKPKNTSAAPNGKVICDTEGNLPRYSHHALNKSNTPPTIRPNSRSARSDFFPMILIYAPRAVNGVSCHPTVARKARACCFCVV